MGKHIVQKIIEDHIVEGGWNPGSEIAIKADQTLTHDNGGALIFMYLEAMEIRRVKSELSVCYIDHNTVQTGFENADDHKYLHGITSKLGVILSGAGNGICHQVHLARFGKPGKILLGSDSHTCTAGGLGMLGIGAGGLDVAVTMSGKPFYLICPKVIKIELYGALNPWVSAKDIVLKVLDMFGTARNENSVFEFAGPGVSTLTVPERSTIANMSAECGVTASIFPSDDNTLSYLKAQNRQPDWMEISADADAVYDDAAEINLDDLEPMIAIPQGPGNVRKVKDVAGLKVDQVAIGSCTNASYCELSSVAKILKGRRVHTDVSLAVAPGSRQVLMMLAQKGFLLDMLSAGARVLEPTCGFCTGSCFAPISHAVCLRTSNRNFLGRSGTKNARVYLASPQTAVAAAITGEIIDPRELGLKFPEVLPPSTYLCDDSLFRQPADNPEKVKIVRGPNLSEPPAAESLRQDISAEVTIKLGDNITTDHIIPGGSRNKYRANIPKYAEYVFEVLDAAFYERAGRIKAHGKSNVIVAGEGYGQGSAREHAALCPMYLGLKAVIAKSFERIHSNNLINFGIIPFNFSDPADYENLNQGDRLEINNIRDNLIKGSLFAIFNVSQNKTITVKSILTERQKHILLAGGLLNTLKLNQE